MTCNSADLVAIASELHLKTAVNPHDIVNASHQQRPAAKNIFYRLFTSKIKNEHGHIRRKQNILHWIDVKIDFFLAKNGDFHTQKVIYYYISVIKCSLEKVIFTMPNKSITLWIFVTNEVVLAKNLEKIVLVKSQSRKIGFSRSATQVCGEHRVYHSTNKWLISTL